MGTVEDDGTIPGDDDPSVTRGFIAHLNDASIMELLGQSHNMKFSICSTADDGNRTFANKKITQLGDDMDPKSLGIGYTCRKGLKPESPNQDSWCILRMDDCFTLYGVFDGHGKHGHFVSNYVKESMPKLILEDQRFRSAEMGAMLRDCFRKMQAILTTADRIGKISAQRSGTTATVAIHDRFDRKLTVAHVADSTCVMGSKGECGWEGRPLTRDHKPNLADERERIEKGGGRVAFDGYSNHRVYMKNARQLGLNMSRCLGDILGHTMCGLTAEPEVSEIQLTDEDKVLLLCSDGVWEFIDAEEAVKTVRNFAGSPPEAMKAADTLAIKAWDRWVGHEDGSVVDDITVLAVFLTTGDGEWVS